MPSDLELATQKHRYRFGGGDPFPSVTAITGLLDDGKSGKMSAAAAKITRESGDYRAEWKAKADRGTRVHKAIEAWLRGEDVEVEPGLGSYLDAAEKYLVENPHEWLHVEPIIVGNGWGGRLDAIGRMPDGRIAIRDWKSGRQYKEHALQVAAYAYGLGIARYDETGMYFGHGDMPTIDVAGCVYLTAEGTYTFTEYGPTELEDAYDAFRGLLNAHYWLKGRAA